MRSTAAERSLDRPCLGTLERDCHLADLDTLSLLEWAIAINNSVRRYRGVHEEANDGRIFVCALRRSEDAECQPGGERDGQVALYAGRLPVPILVESVALSVGCAGHYSLFSRFCPSTILCQP